MREIKFRAWDKRNKKMFGVSGYFMDMEVKKRKYILERWGGSEENDVSINIPFDEIELMQYTGLKDKNGKEIYEGDIVRNTYDRNITKNKKVTTKTITEICTFRWDKHWASFKWGNGIVENMGIFEVIGNIYENKELLK